MRNYSADILHRLQNAIDENKLEIKTFENESELPKTIYLDGIKMSFVENNNTKDIVKYADVGFANLDNNTWKNTPLFKYYRYDWKKNQINLQNYIEVKIFINELVIIGFLKKLEKPEQVTNEEGIEIITPELEQFNEDSDLLINDDVYTIIKLYIDEFEDYTKNSRLEDRNYIEDALKDYTFEKTDDNSNDDDNSNMDSEVLF